MVLGRCVGGATWVTGGGKGCGRKEGALHAANDGGSGGPSDRGRATDEDGIATATDRLSVLQSAGLAAGSRPTEEVAAAPALALALMSLAFAAWRRACSWAFSPECDSPRSRHN